MRIIKSFIILTVLSLCPFVVTSQELQSNHLQANLPDSFEEFNIFLSRDLTTYFSAIEGKQVTIEYELLRKQPTQSGISYPKFYAWVVVKYNDNILNEGAVRVASINKVKIEVTDYISSKNVRANPKEIETIFPRSLCNTIKKNQGYKFKMPNKKNALGKNKATVVPPYALFSR